jgi:CMP-N-acetylneuraminic acid synthetase
MRDGTCYVFWRKTVEQHGTIYGQDVRPLIIDPADSCELDTELDWAACVRRWEEIHGHTRV